MKYVLFLINRLFQQLLDVTLLIKLYCMADMMKLLSRLHYVVGDSIRLRDYSCWLDEVGGHDGEVLMARD